MARLSSSRGTMLSTSNCGRYGFATSPSDEDLLLAARSSLSSANVYAKLSDLRFALSQNSGTLSAGVFRPSGPPTYPHLKGLLGTSSQI
jgi:hypothetical protein